MDERFGKNDREQGVNRVALWIHMVMADSPSTKAELLFDTCLTADSCQG